MKMACRAIRRNCETLEDVGKLLDELHSDLRKRLGKNKGGTEWVGDLSWSINDGVLDCNLNLHSDEMLLNIKIHKESSGDISVVPWYGYEKEVYNYKNLNSAAEYIENLFEHRIEKYVVENLRVHI